MKRQLPKTAIATIILSVLMIASIITIPASAKNQKLPDKTCQCVEFVTNSLFGFDENGIGNKVKQGSWIPAWSLADQTYWDYAHEEYPQAGLYTQVKSPVSPIPGDVMIMQPDSVVHVKRTDGIWDKLSNIGLGFGHIGFVQSAFFYDKDAEKANPDFKGMSGWLITMQSANWGKSYISETGLTDMNVPNLYGSYISTNNAGCTNVNESTIFLPSPNPVSFWRKAK
jgi:hypothetical protein